MYLTGLGDEAGASIDVQIRATKELGWKDIEVRAVEVPGFPAGNIHDIPDRAFDILAVINVGIVIGQLVHHIAGAQCRLVKAAGQLAADRFALGF